MKKLIAALALSVSLISVAHAATLSGTSPANTFGNLLQAPSSNAGVSTSLIQEQDGKGNALDFWVATTSAQSDSNFQLVDATDNTKVLKFTLSGITTGTTRIWTWPNSSDTVVGLAATQTLTNKTLTTPVLGVATATTINKVTLTTPATGSTLTIADGKTLTASNTLSLAGTDSTTMTFPSTSQTVVGLTATQTLTNKTMTAPMLNNPTISDAINAGSSVCATELDRTSSAVLTNIPNLTANVTAAGTYKFAAHITGTAGASGGAKFAIGGTATATTFSATAFNYNAGTINAVSTTTTLGSAIGGANAIFTDAVIEGAIVVNAGGTLTVQLAQNTSNGTATSAYVMSAFSVTRTN